MTFITTTNNYFADLATAVEANLFTRNGKNPKKADLYLAIDAHNAQLVKAPTATIVKAAKATKSNPSRKIADLIKMLTVGTTKEAICQAFQWKSWNPKTSVVLNYGYNLQFEDGIYSIAK